MALSLVTRTERGRAIVALAGDVDVVTAAELREHLAGVCAAEAGIIVDLTRVGFLDSAGLGVLVGALKRARARGGTLQLVCPDRRIRDVLTVTGLTREFGIHDTVDGAAGGSSAPPEGRPRGA